MVEVAIACSFAAMGELQAAHLLERGFRSFARGVNKLSRHTGCEGGGVNARYVRHYGISARPSLWACVPAAVADLRRLLYLMDLRSTRKPRWLPRRPGLLQ